VVFYYPILSCFCKMMSLSNPNPDLVETKLSIRGEHGSGLDRTASGLTPILAGSDCIFFENWRTGLDRLRKFVLF